MVVGYQLLAISNASNFQQACNHVTQRQAWPQVLLVVMAYHLAWGLLHFYIQLTVWAAAVVGDSCSDAWLGT